MMITKLFAMKKLSFVVLRCKPLSMPMGYLSTDDDCGGFCQCRLVTYRQGMIVKLFAMKGLRCVVLRGKALSMSMVYLSTD